MEMTMQIEHTRFQGDDRAVREDQRPSGRVIHSIWIGYQGDPQSLIETIAAPVMVAAHQVQLAFEQ
jgi:hypothetical protein